LAAVSAAGAASASPSTAERICGRAATGAAAFPSDSALESAATQVESAIERERFEGTGVIRPEVVAALDVAGSVPQAPGARAVAQFCSAAGEAMRLATDGSQRQAQIYLQTAFHNARTAQLPDTTAITAYRLGVVSISGPSVAGLRGGEPVRRNGGRIAARLRSAEGTEDTSGEICSALADVKVGAAADPAISMLALDCAARLAKESGIPAVSALATLRFARFALDWRDSADDPDALLQVARDKSLAAIDVAAAIPDTRLRVEMIGRLARIALQLGAQPSVQLQRAVIAMRTADSRDGNAVSVADEVEARLALAAGNRAAAKPLLERALLYESSRPLPARLPELYLLLAEADPAQRQRYVAAAYTALENIRPRLPRLDPLTEESMFSLHMRQVFVAAADAQLSTVADGREDHIRSAQQIVEAFREAELQSAVGSECLPARSAVKAEDLAEGETLLYPLLFDDRVELIYVSGGPGGGQFRRLPPNPTANRREVARLAEAMVVGLTTGSDDAWKQPAARLYEILIKPVEDHLTPRSTLAIIPDGPLRGVPFAALVAGDGQYLVQKTAITVAPALAYSQPGDIRRSTRLNIVAASLAKRVELPAGTFPALTGASDEARIAASNGSPGQLVVNFTRAQLLAALNGKPVDVLHLATHAAFNGRSDRAFIVADGEVIRLSELRDILAENRVRGDLLDLLVLSACETAVGDDEASMGLAGAAV
jgi:CHAT domain-containing protein